MRVCPAAPICNKDESLVVTTVKGRRFCCCKGGKIFLKFKLNFNCGKPFFLISQTVNHQPQLNLRTVNHKLAAEESFGGLRHIAAAGLVVTSSGSARKDWNGTFLLAVVSKLVQTPNAEKISSPMRRLVSVSAVWVAATAAMEPPSTRWTADAFQIQLQHLVVLMLLLAPTESTGTSLFVIASRMKTARFKRAANLKFGRQNSASASALRRAVEREKFKEAIANASQKLPAQTSNALKILSWTRSHASVTAL